MKAILSLLLLFISFHAFTQNEITLYDENGNAINYIDRSSGVVYTFDGEPVGYLKAKSNYYNIFNYKGKHLGWFEDGIVRDHQGEIAGFQKGAVTNVYTKIEPYKKARQYEPYRSYEDYEPYKPYYSVRFSRIPLGYFFSNSTASGSSSVSPYNNQAYVPKIEPFSPDFNLLNDVLTRLQQQHENLIKNGYIYDEETEQYIHESQFEGVKQERIKQIGLAIKECIQSAYFKNNEQVKDGRHKVYYFNCFRSFPLLYTTDVIVKRNKIKKIIVNGKKWPAFESTTIDKGIAVSRFKSGSDFSNLYRTITKYPKHFFLFVD